MKGGRDGRIRGIDWAEDHHDIALADGDGKLLARQRISDDAAGLARAAGLLAAHGDSAEDPIPVAIETPRGLLVACLGATGRNVYPINPMAVARYRDRHSVACRKSDHGDASSWPMCCAPTARAPAAARDSELARAIAVLARARQDAVWDRTAGAQQAPLPPARVLPRVPGRVRRRPRRHHAARGARYPGGSAYPGRRGETDPAAAARSAAQGGRNRGIDAEAQRLREAFRMEQMRQLPLVEEAMGNQHWRCCAS